MALATHPTIDHRWPDLATALEARVDYDSDSDSLMVSFAPDQPAVNIPIDTGERDYIFLLVDLDTNEIIGIEVEDVRAHALARHPTWKMLVAVASGTATPMPPTRRQDLAAFLADVVALAKR